MLKKEDDQLIPDVPIENIDRECSFKQKTDSSFMKSQKKKNLHFKS